MSTLYFEEIEEGDELAPIDMLLSKDHRAALRQNCEYVCPAFHRR